MTILNTYQGKFVLRSGPIIRDQAFPVVECTFKKYLHLQVAAHMSLLNGVESIKIPDRSFGPHVIKFKGCR